MKKLVSFVLILSMLCSLLAVPVFAADTTATYKRGDVLYEQDFSNFDVASAKPYGYAAGNGGALQNFEVKDGALRINSSNKDAAGKDIGGRYGTRLELYAIPDDVMRYSIEMDLYIDAYHNTTASQGPALLIADNGITDASTAEKLSEFSMFWFRYTKKGTTGTYTYGDTSQNVVDANVEGFCEPGTWYHLEIYIDRTDIMNRWGTFRATNKTTGAIYTAEGFGFNPLAHKAIVGLYSNGTDTKYDNIKVTYGDAYFGNAEPTTGSGWGTNVLYEQDFSNYDVASAKPYGYAAGNGGALKNFEVVDGALRINSSNKDSADKDIGGRYGTRLELYAIPDDVNQYSIEMDLYIDAYHNTTASQGPALLLADNGITDASTAEKLSEFSMFWFRYTKKGTTGTYTYGDTSQNVVDANVEGFCEPGTWYHLEIYIDRSDVMNRWGTFRATNKTTGATYTAEGFGFNPLAHKAIVGLYSNGTDTKYDNIKVTYGDAYFGNAEPGGDADWGTNVLYEQDFSSFDVASVTPYGYAAGNGGALKNFEVVDGALRINSSNKDSADKDIGGRYGTRVELYAIPDDVNYYSIEMDLYIDAYHNTTASQGPALLIADNGITDASLSEKNSEFSMFWFRYTKKGTTGTYTYGDTSQNVVDANVEGFCEPGTWYHLEIYIDRSDVAGRWGSFRATNKTTGAIYTAEGFGFNPLAHKAIVGLYNNGTDTRYDNIKVTYGDAYFGNAAPGSGTDTPDEPETPLDLTSPEAPKVNDADVLYSQDFTYYSALTETIYGYGGVSGALKTYEVENGILHFESQKADGNGVALGGRFGSRVKLYEIPDDVTQFSISMDLYLDKYAGSSASYGPALLLADNGVTDSSTKETLSQFSMIWLRQQGVGTSGAYTYGDTSLNVVSSAEPGITVPECWYRIQVYADVTNPLDPLGMFRITNLSTNEVYETDYFCYNVLDLNRIVGLYNNATNCYIDNIYVVKGNAFLQDLVAEPVVTEPPQTTTKAPETDEPVESTPAVTETVAPVTSATEPGDTTSDPNEPAGGISPIVIVVVAVVLIGACVACFFVIPNKTVKYIIIAVVAVALVVFVIVSATAGGKQTDDGPGDDVVNEGTTTASGAVGGSDTTPAETEPQYTLPEVPELQGEVINILSWKERTWDEFGAEMQNGDLFNDAKYARNVQIEELYGVTFEVNEEVAGNSGATDNYLAFVSNSVNSGSREFDIIAGYSQTMCSLPARGLLWDMLDTDHLDFEHEWWPKRLVEEFTIGDKLFICSGDIAPSSLYQMYMIYFNKTILAENQLENPYELVMDGKWTLDKMIEMSTGIYADLNGNGLKDYGDRFGFVTAHLHLDPFFYAVGSKIVEKDINGDLILSPSLTGEKTLATIDKLQTILFDGNDGWMPNNNSGADSKTYTAFAENQVLFTSDASDVAATQFQKDDLEFGIVPTPKYDEEQDDYITLFRYYMSYYGIPIDAMNPDASSAMMQALAYYNYKEIVPAVYEQSLKLKYANADEDATMYDIIRENQTYDIGRLFSKAIIGPEGQALFRVNVGNNNSRWASAVRSLQSRWLKGIAALQEACEG